MDQGEAATTKPKEPLTLLAKANLAGGLTEKRAKNIISPVKEKSSQLRLQKQSYTNLQKRGMKQ